MKLTRLLATVLLPLCVTTSAHAALIDFSYVDQFAGGGYNLVHRIDDVTFSHHLTSQYNDGFSWQSTSQNVYNYYGEQGEFFTFDNAVTFESIDIGRMNCCVTPAGLSISLFSATNTLLASTSFPTPSSLTTVNFGVANVKRVQFNFTGGSTFYSSDQREHGWYIIDNIRYGANSSAVVPLPAALPLAGAGLGVLGLLGYGRRRSQSA